MAKVKIEPAGKAVIAVMLLAVLGGAYFLWGRPLLNKTDKPTSGSAVAAVAATGSPAAVAAGQGTTLPVATLPGQPTAKRTYKVALSQWPGHMAGVLACGGLKTQPGSFCSKVESTLRPGDPGLDLEFVFIEEPDKKNGALQTGSVDAVWQTTDELPINLPGYAKAGVTPKAFVQIDWSRKGDGCAATQAVKKPRDMLTHKGAVLKFSPDHTVLEYWMTNGDLNPEELAKARGNISFSMDDFTFARNLFCQGQVDLACLWEPDLQQALACRPGAHLVFSTGDASTLVADNLLAKADFLAASPDVAEKIVRIFLEGARIGTADPKGAAKLISTVVPRFRDELKYEGTLAAIGWVRWNDLGDNATYFGLDGSPPMFDKVYKQADQIWGDYVEADGTPALTQRFVPGTLRDGSIVKAVYDIEMKARAEQAAAAGTIATPISAEKPVYNPAQVALAEPKLVKAVTINFETGSSTLDINARSILKQQVLSQVDFVQGMGFRVEGNTDSTGDRVANKKLSVRRAAAVRDFLVTQGVDPNRIVSQGNGPDSPVCQETTPECYATNRRTDIVFVSLNSASN